MKPGETAMHTGVILCCTLVLFVNSSSGQTDPTERISANVESVNDKIYVMAGMTLTGNVPGVSAYSPGGRTWENKTPIPTPRSAAASAVLDDLIYVVGGRSGNSVLATCEKYSPAEGRWSSGRPMPTARWSLMTAGAAGKIYACGGISGVGNNRKTLDSVEVYDPKADVWEAAARMPQPCHSAAIAAVGNHVYVISGKIAAYTEAVSGEPITERAECLDTVAGTWRQIKPIPTGRTGARAVVFKERIFVVGGIGKTGEFPVTIDIYDPKSDTWEPGPKLEKGRSGHACAVLGSTLYVIGGTGVRYGSGTPTIFKGVETLTLP